MIRTSLPREFLQDLALTLEPRFAAILLSHGRTGLAQLLEVIEVPLGDADLDHAPVAVLLATEAQGAAERHAVLGVDDLPALLGLVVLLDAVVDDLGGSLADPFNLVEAHDLGKLLLGRGRAL